MRLLKPFIIIITAMIGFFMIISLLLPSKITVSKTVLINASPAAVLEQLSVFDNWKNWYPLFQNKNIILTQSQNGDSSFATLNDDHHKPLSMAMIPGNRKNLEVLLFADDKSNTSYQFILLPKSVGQTQLTWNVNTRLDWYPWKKITGIFLDKVTGPQYEAALQKLKLAAEKSR